jgi:hypothetical protein
MSKKILYGILGALVLSVVLFYLKAKSWIKQFKFGIASGVRITKISLTKIDVYLPLWFYNPAPIDAVISDLDLKIFFDGYYISSIKSPKHIALVSKRNSTYPIDISLSIGQALEYLGDRGEIINDPDWLKQVEITIIGSVTFEIGLIKMKKFPIKIVDSLKSYVG